jgi:hypothetical protein
MGILVERKKVIFLDIFSYIKIYLQRHLFRQDPPTQEELLKNLAIMDMKKKNAAILEGKFEKPQDHASIKHDTATGRAAFPRYDEEYEIMPGSKPIKQKD